MKKIFRLLFLLALGTAATSTVQAQRNYTTGIGFRGGAASGITLKHFIQNDVAIEGILSSSFRYRGTVLTVLYEKHAPAFNAPGLQWYYGLGGHIGIHNGRHYYYDRNRRPDYGVFGVGIDGILGLEYYIGDIPFTIGADIKPYLNIPLSGGGFWDTALHVRYVF